MTDLHQPPTAPFGVQLDPLIVHDEELAGHYLERLERRKDRLQFKRPAELALVTVSNYPEKTLAERSFDALGLSDHVVLGRHIRQKWTHNLKIDLTLDYLKSAACTSEFVLVMDARDAVLLGDPARILELVRQSGRDVLFSTTDWIADDLAAERSFARSIAPAGSDTPFLCMGVIVGQRERLREFLERARTLIDRRVSRVTPTCDQAIFNVLQRENEPQSALDYWQHLALRAAVNEPYLIARDPALPTLRGWLEERWWWHALAALKQIIERLPALVTTWGNHEAHGMAVWAVKRRWNRIRILLREQSGFARAIAALRQSVWFA